MKHLSRCPGTFFLRWCSSSEATKRCPMGADILLVMSCESQPVTSRAQLVTITFLNSASNSYWTTNNEMRRKVLDQDRNVKGDSRLYLCLASCLFSDCSSLVIKLKRSSHTGIPLTLSYSGPFFLGRRLEFN